MAEFVRVFGRGELPPGEARQVTVQGRELAVFNVGGTFHAVAAHCTHEDAPLAEGTVVAGVLECPWHGARFDLASCRVLSLPAVKGVQVYPVRVRGEDVEVALP